ncbi:methyltransferase domain-containing protein [Micromonospora sp. NPDC003776]
MDQRHLLMHQAMLGDRPRLEAYDKALAATVHPGAVVADIGAGTLALTALALRHGASHVYAVEADPEMVGVAARLIEDNGWADRVTLVAGDARLTRLPVKADVVVCELIGNLGPEEDMTRILQTFTRRNLRPGGVVVPERLITHLAPIQFDEEGWGIWHAGFLDMRLDAVQELVEAVAHLHFFSRKPVVLGAPQTLADSAAGQHTIKPERTVRLPVERAGSLHAIVGYFTATLAPGVTLTNMPSYPGCNWAVWVWPLRHTPVAGGETVHARMLRPAGAEARDVTGWRLDCRLDRGVPT